MEKMPIFVRIDEYDNVRKIVDTVRTKLAMAKETLTKINELKNEEDHQLEMWQGSLDEIERKVDFIEQALSEPEQL